MKILTDEELECLTTERLLAYYKSVRKWIAVKANWSESEELLSWPSAYKLSRKIKSLLDNRENFEPYSETYFSNGRAVKFRDRRKKSK